MEARIAHLESDVTHLLSDVADIKIDVRSLRDRVDLGKLGNDADTTLHRLDDKIDQLARSLARTQVWAVLLYVALAGGMLGTMARGFGWL